MKHIDQMPDSNLYKKIYQVLRIAVAMCFIGHGAFGIITKPIWCNYFAVFGIGKQTAYSLMPIVGGFDILCGILMLAYPNRLVVSWLVIWGFVTALLRPLSGENFGEFIERAGNYGAPLALLILIGFPKKLRDLFSPISSAINPSEQNIKYLFTCLKIAGFMLLAAHGWLNLSMKQGLLLQYSRLGFSDVTTVAKVIGMIEIAAAFTILIKPYREIIFVFFLWKMLSETLYPAYTIFEWIERGGSYGVLLALWLLSKQMLFKAVPGKTVSANA